MDICNKIKIKLNEITKNHTYILIPLNYSKQIILNAYLVLKVDSRIMMGEAGNIMAGEGVYNLSRTGRVWTAVSWWGGVCAEP